MATNVVPPDLDLYGPVIRQQVMAALGAAAGRSVVRVRPLWGNNYRVNVFLDAGPTEGRITHSYFLVVDDAGLVIASTPALAR
jgi:hypothetical protein